MSEEIGSFLEAVDSLLQQCAAHEGTQDTGCFANSSHPSKLYGNYGNRNSFVVNKSWEPSAVNGICLKTELPKGFEIQTKG